MLCHERLTSEIEGHKNLLCVFFFFFIATKKPFQYANSQLCPKLLLLSSSSSLSILVYPWGDLMCL